MTADAAVSDVRKAISNQAASSPPQLVIPCEQLTWIEIRLFDMEGNPVPGEPYRIRKPDSSIVEGSLDADGLARLDGLRPGTCGICFPERDEEAWERI